MAPDDYTLYSTTHQGIHAYVRKRSWWARRNKRLAGRIVDVCMNRWDEIESGEFTKADIRRELTGGSPVGNPFVLIAIQILLPIIIELVRKWLENRDK